MLVACHLHVCEMAFIQMHVSENTAEVRITTTAFRLGHPAVICNYQVNKRDR
jgi:hypothetical protein